MLTSDNALRKAVSNVALYGEWWANMHHTQSCAFLNFITNIVSIYLYQNATTNTNHLSIFSLLHDLID